jgi:adenylate cyclase
VSEEPLRLSQTVVETAVRDRKAFLYRRGLGDNESMSIVTLEIRSAMCAPLVGGGKVVGLLYADTKNLLHPFDDQHLKVFSTLAKLSAVAVEEARLREEIAREHAIREGLSRYSGKAVVDRIIASTGGQMIVDEADVSVLFADLVGFTSLAENLTASEVTRVLNGVFDQLTRAVFECEGTLDKFIGDEVMAFFGAPLPQPDHPKRAVRAALRLQEKLREYNAAHPDQKPLAMRIGINSGSVVVGDIGSLERKDYTVIGDTVNTAKRIESAAAGPGDIVIGQATYQAVKDCFTCEPLAPIELKGKRVTVQTYRVLSAIDRT